MSTPVHLRFKPAIAGMINKDPVTDAAAVICVVNILNEVEFDINSMEQLKSITTTANIWDACSFAFTMLAEYSTFAINNLSQNGISPLVQSYGESHGAYSPGTVVLTVVSNTFIPAVGSMATAQGTRNMGPNHNLPIPPEYEHPGPQDNDFAPIVTMPLATFIVSNVVGDAVSALIGNPEWAPYVKAMGGVAAAFKQIYDTRVWQECEILPTPLDPIEFFRRPRVRLGVLPAYRQMHRMSSCQRNSRSCVDEQYSRASRVSSPPLSSASGVGLRPWF